VLYLHGNDSNVGTRLNILHCEKLRAVGLNVIAAEYRGFGGMDGVPTEAGLDSDARSAYDYLQQQLHADPEADRHLRLVARIRRRPSISRRTSTRRY